MPVGKSFARKSVCMTDGVLATITKKRPPEYFQKLHGNN